MQVHELTGKLAYFFIFWMVIPIILVVWAVSMEGQIFLPDVQSDIGGIILTGVGILLIGWASLMLWVKGNGLPMNAFPPNKKVTTGPYRFFNDPIYLGAALICAGISIYSGSSAALWLITPIFILSMGALVFGYERLDLRERFPKDEFNPWFSFPEAIDEKPSFYRRISMLLLVVAFWSVLSWIFAVLTGRGDIPIIPITDGLGMAKPMQMSVFIWVLVIIFPLLTNTKIELREWVIRSLIGLFFISFFSLMFFGSTASFGFTGEWLNVGSDWLLNPPVVIVWITLLMLVKRKTWWSMLMAMLLAFMIVYEFVSGSGTIVMHFVTVFFAAIAFGYREIWGILRKGSEIIANSWKEWVIGPVRIINHGFYVGIAAFLGITAAGLLTGSLYAWSILVFSVVVVLFSAIWAQLIEGSEKLKRPYGYYGALVGIIFGSGILWLMGTDVWMIIAVVSVLMPWVQAIGRLRCLINGCCHGSLTVNPEVGIRYLHHRSRVTNISGLKGELLYPTPLYAILWLFFCGFILLKFWISHMSPSFIFGMYLILTGIGRFVEEAYRGEVQTRIIYGLRLYQWTAITSLLIGIGVTLWPTAALNPSPAFNLESIYAGLIGGLFVFFAMGVDFPNSNARFSRLV